MMAYITSEVDTPSWFKIRKILVLQTGIVDYAYAQIIRAKTIQEQLNSQKKLDTFEFAAFFKSPCMPRLGKKACLFPKCKQKK